MNIGRYAAIAVLPLFLTAASAPLVLQPSGGWEVDYANDSCRLTRTFGSKTDPTTLSLERVSPDSSMMMLVVSQHLAASMSDRDFVAQLLPGTKVRYITGQAGLADGSKIPAVLWSSVSFNSSIDERSSIMPAEIRETLLAARKSRKPVPIPKSASDWLRADAEANAKATTAIHVSRRTGTPLVLNTGSLGPPMAMLKQCAVSQLRGWGIDPVLEEKIAKRALPVSWDWFSADDYPPRALAEFRESQLIVRALVDASGRVTKCTPVTRVSNADIPRKVCDVMTKRVRFHAAELADGTKVPSYYTQTLRFVIAG